VLNSKVVIQSGGSRRGKLADNDIAAGEREQTIVFRAVTVSPKHCFQFVRARPRFAKRS